MNIINRRQALAIVATAVATAALPGTSQPAFVIVNYIAPDVLRWGTVLGVVARDDETEGQFRSRLIAALQFRPGTKDGG